MNMDNHSYHLPTNHHRADISIRHQVHNSTSIHNPNYLEFHNSSPDIHRNSSLHQGNVGVALSVAHLSLTKAVLYHQAHTGYRTSRQEYIAALSTSPTAMNKLRTIKMTQTPPILSHSFLVFQNRMSHLLNTKTSKKAWLHHLEDQALFSYFPPFSPKKVSMLRTKIK
jgi:hypothetical protein